jgi:hypothetical protein
MTDPPRETDQAPGDTSNSLRETGRMEPITVLIWSWNRPIYLWACLDSLYRYTRRPARFILIDNHSDDPLVHEVICGFERRGMFHAVERAPPHIGCVSDAAHYYRPILGEFFVFIESDAVVFDTEPCWLSRLCSLMDAHPNLGMLGSYIDGTDFVDPERAAEVAPDMEEARRDFLIKKHSPERGLPAIPPAQEIIDPFNPPGRLLMLRTWVLDLIGPDDWADSVLYRKLKEVGVDAGIATEVRHRHLSLVNFFDYQYARSWWDPG